MDRTKQYLACFVLLTITQTGCANFSDLACNSAPDMLKQVHLAALEEQVIQACEVHEGHLVPDRIVELLTSYMADLDGTLYICNNFCDELFCWKNASQLNPNLRQNICACFSEYLWRAFPEERFGQFREGHNQDCQLGLPQFIY